MPLISFFFLNIDLSEQWMLQTGFYTHSLQGENQEEYATEIISTGILEFRISAGENWQL